MPRHTSFAVAALAAALLVAGVVPAIGHDQGGPKATATTDPCSPSPSPTATPPPEPSPTEPPPTQPPPPAPAGKPGPDNTGPRIPLTPSGSITVSTPDTIVEGLDITGTLTVNAPRVTVRDVRVVAESWYGIRVNEGASDVVLEHVEVRITQVPSGNAAVAAWGGRLTMRNSELWGDADGVKMGDGDLYEGNWIHMTDTHNSGIHLDGLQADGGGTGIVIRGNFIDQPAAEGGNATVIINGALGPSGGDNLIEGNWLNGGNYTLMVGENKDGSCQPGTVVTGNRFGRDYQWGLLRDGGCPVDWSGNVWDDTGEPV